VLVDENEKRQFVNELQSVDVLLAVEQEMKPLMKHMVLVKVDAEDELDVLEFIVELELKLSVC
jgi:hypothetical protein